MFECFKIKIKIKIQYFSGILYDINRYGLPEQLK